MQQGTGEYAVRIYLDFVLDHAHPPAPTTPLDRWMVNFCRRLKRTEGSNCLSSDEQLSCQLISMIRSLSVLVSVLEDTMRAADAKSDTWTKQHVLSDARVKSALE